MTLSFLSLACGVLKVLEPPQNLVDDDFSMASPGGDTSLAGATKDHGGPAGEEKRAQTHA